MSDDVAWWRGPVHVRVWELSNGTWKAYATLPRPHHYYNGEPWVLEEEGPTEQVVRVMMRAAIERWRKEKDDESADRLARDAAPVEQW